MPARSLAFGSRTAARNAVFGGQTMVHAKVRIDETATPVAVDYLNLDGRKAGSVSRAIIEWVGDEPRFLMAPPGAPRPSDFSAAASKGTLSRWRRK